MPYRYNFHLRFHLGELVALQQIPVKTRPSCLRLEEKSAQEKDFAYRINSENAFKPHGRTGLQRKLLVVLFLYCTC